MKRISELLLVLILLGGIAFATIKVYERNAPAELMVDITGVNFCYSLRTSALPEADNGGDWSIVSLPVGSTLVDADIVGDNPCVDFDVVGCGTYVLKYSVESDICANCVAETDLTVYKCCLVGSATCS